MYFISDGFWQMLLLFVLVLFPLLAMVDILKGNFRGIDKLVWVILVLALNLIGTLLYFLIGRNQKLPREFPVGSPGDKY